MTRDGLLVDFGGVLTTNVFESFAEFCREEGLEPDTVRDLFMEDPAARDALADLETARATEAEFEARFASLLGLATAEGLIARMFAGMRPDERMFDAVAAAKRAGIRTGLVSNSWGEEGYDRTRFAELFDAIVISGEIGHPQAGARDLRARRRAARAGARALRVRRRPRRQPQAGARASGWRRCCTATPRRRSRSSSSTSA